MNSSKFVKVKCDKCKNEQVIFSKSASKINCLVCNAELGKSTGGKTNINSKSISKL